MKTFLGILVFFATALFLSVASVASADQFNDRYFLQPGSPPLDLTHESGEGDGGSIFDQNESEDPAEDVPEVPEPQTVNPITNFPPVETEEDVLEVFISHGALNITESTSTEEIWNSSYSIIVDGDSVRSWAGFDVNIDDVLRFWKGKGIKKTQDGKTVAARGKLTTGQYYALLASELASNDAQLESAAMSASRFEIKYRSRGALFAIIPFSFPVRVEVVGAAATADDRVHVKLPWYRFFIRKYFSANSLEMEIDAIVLKELAALPPGSEDVQAILFTAVADFLKQKVRTISDSILLGQ